MKNTKKEKIDYILGLFRQYAIANGNPDPLLQYALAEGYSVSEAKRDITKVGNLWKAVELFVSKTANN